MMKKFIYIFLTIFVGFATFVACDKKEDDKTPDTNAAQKECENEGGYWENGKCIKIPPITVKDTVILVNFPSSGGFVESSIGIPDRSVLEQLKQSGYTVFCRFYRRENDNQSAPSIQTGPSVNRVGEHMDAIVAYYVDGLLTWVEGDTVLISGSPTPELVNKGKSIQKPLTIIKKADYDNGNKSAGNGSKAARVSNNKFSTKNERNFAIKSE